MIKNSVKIIFFAWLSLFLFIPSSTKAQVASSTPDTATSTSPFIIQKVKEAQAILDTTNLGYKNITIQGVYKKKKTYVRYLQRDVAVIGLNMTTGALRTFIFKENLPAAVKKRTTPKGSRTLASADGCDLVWRGGSFWGFSRDMILKCAEGDLPIVGLKFPYPTKGTSGVIQESYVPYSPELHTAEVAKVGRDYLNKVINEASAELDKQGVRSRTFPDMPIGDMIPSDFMMSIIINEHMDHALFTRAIENGTISQLVEKVWVTVGLNQEKAMKWSVSSAGACCLTQFMPKTYQMVVRNYPDAELNPKLSGRQDHVNAIKASIVLFDSDIAGGWREKTKITCLSSVDMMEKCLAASYNAGPGTLNKVIKKLGAAWDNGPIRLGRFGIGLRNETVVYLKKLDTIKSYLVSLNK